MTITELLDALAKEARVQNPGKPASFFAPLDFRLREISALYDTPYYWMPKEEWDDPATV